MRDLRVVIRALDRLVSGWTGGRLPVQRRTGQYR